MGHNHSPEGPKKDNGPKERQPKRQNQQQEQQGEQRLKSLRNRRPKPTVVKLKPAWAVAPQRVSSRRREEERIQQTEFKKERQRQLEEQWRQDMQRSPESMTQASDTERE
jgi:hypothetical protein